MAPENKIVEKKKTEEIAPQDEYVRQVEDNSRPAQEILTDQRERPAGEMPAVFVP